MEEGIIGKYRKKRYDYNEDVRQFVKWEDYMDPIDNKGEVIIYQTDDGLTHIDVRMDDETVWLTQQQMADLFQSSRTNVVEHIKHIYDEEELDENLTCRKFRQVRQEGGRQVERKMPFYNLDMIISLGYRIKLSVATKFRKWVTERLKEYMIKGFTMDDERLKGNGGGNYWKELLGRIRDIRSSEKVLIVKCLTCTLPVWITIQIVRNLLDSSKLFRTNYILRLMVIQRQKLSMKEPMRKNHSWV